MKKEKLTNQQEAVQASTVRLLVVEQFIQNHYIFRRNVLSGKLPSYAVCYLSNCASIIWIT